MAQMGQFVPAHLSPLDSGTSWTHCSEAGSQSMETQVPSALSQSPKALDPKDAAGTIDGLHSGLQRSEVYSGCGASISSFPSLLCPGGWQRWGCDWAVGVPEQGEGGPPPPNAGLSV